MIWIKDLGLRPSNIIRNGKPRNFTWALYKCEFCGAEVERNKGKMQNSGPKSCGCLSGDVNGDHNTSLYGVWKSMRQRCRLPSSSAYHHYGARGIDVCQEWYDSYLVFKAWALANGYKEGLSIDRKDPDGNYTAANCRWVTKDVQSRNTRRLNIRNKTGYRGVSWNTRDKVYCAFITVNGKSISLGSFKVALEAAKAYDTYVILNNLEHTINGVLHEPIKQQTS